MPTPDQAGPSRVTDEATHRTKRKRTTSLAEELGLGWSSDDESALSAHHRRLKRPRWNTEHDNRGPRPRPVSIVVDDTSDDDIMPISPPPRPRPRNQPPLFLTSSDDDDIVPLPSPRLPRRQPSPRLPRRRPYNPLIAYPPLPPTLLATLQTAEKDWDARLTRLRKSTHPRILEVIGETAAAVRRHRTGAIPHAAELRRLGSQLAGMERRLGTQHTNVERRREGIWDQARGAMNARVAAIGGNTHRVEQAILRHTLGRPLREVDIRRGPMPTGNAALDELGLWHDADGVGNERRTVQYLQQCADQLVTVDMLVDACEMEIERLRGE